MKQVVNCPYDYVLHVLFLFYQLSHDFGGAKAVVSSAQIPAEI